MEKYPWFGAFYELLNVHSTIDQHPILHGPSYLMYGPAKTAVYYFQEAKNGDKDVTEMLPQSLRLIQEFLRNWSDLTDQLLRIDDLVFHGFGNNSALFMTLPECALDFYHAILLEFIDLLIRADENDGRCLNNDRGPYESDFLLVPELHSGISIEPMFLADGLKNGQDLHNGATGKRILWPLKQAYLVRFPIETVYAPERFFISLIHECFHYFGDACRLRGRRTKFICAFMASSIVWYLGYVRASVQNKQLFHSIYQYLTNEFSDIPEPNRKESEKRLGSGLDKLFTTDGLNKILESAGGANQETFQRDDVLLKWYNGQFALASRCATGEFASNWGSVIADCFYYFQECYADYMTIRLLGLNVEEYLKLFEEESKSSVAVEGLMADAQRIAVVLAACTEHGIPGFDPKATEKAFAAVPDMPASFLRVIQACRAALWDRDQVFTLGKEEQPYSMAIHPTVVLSYVADYLGEVNAAFRTHFVNAPIAEDYRELKDKYDFFFRKGNFLSNKYFRVIRNNHNRVRSDARESLLKKAAASVEKPDFDAALQYLNDAINMSSDQFAGDFYTRGNACLALGRFEEAEASFRRAIELQPDFAPAYIGRGDAYCEMASFEHAIADYNKAMELQPDNPSVFQKQAAALRSLGKDLLAEQCEAKVRALSGEKI